MKRLENRIAFITGASSGIGRSIACSFAAEGARLVLCARRQERLESLASELAAAHGTLTYIRGLDVRDSAAVSAMVAELPPEWREIDILVNDAGLSRGLDKVHEATIDDWDEMLDTNVKGLLYVSRAVLPGMVARDRGHVVNIGSIAGRELYAGGSVYCASKFAERAISKGMLVDLNGRNIRITTVDPGLVETEFSKVRFHGDTERAAKVYKGVDPLTPDDIAEAVLFAVTRPAHMNIAEMVILATCQAGAAVVSRK